MFEESRLFAEKLGFSTCVLSFFAHEEPMTVGTTFPVIETLMEKALVKPY